MFVNHINFRFSVRKVESRFYLVLRLILKLILLKKNY